MTKQKLKELYIESQKIIEIMTELNISSYKNYSLKFSSHGTFLMLNDTFISDSLKNSYIDENLNNFIPATKINVMKKFENDIKKNIFKELENWYNSFTDTEEK